MNEQQFKLFKAAQDARLAINECIGVFVGLAKAGSYPESLIGRGWQFAVDARDALMPAVQPFMPEDPEPDLPEGFDL